MSNIFKAREITNVGSGGKIVRARRIRAATSPYARPLSTPTPSPPPSPSGNPNWLFSATRMIANGAGKLISTLLSPTSSSSSSDSGDDSMSEDDDDGDDDTSSQEADRVNKNLVTSENHVEVELQPKVRNSEAKLTIEKLLMQETFSRDECNRLTEIILSRVVEDIGNLSAITIVGASEPDWQIIKPQTTYSSLGTGYKSLSPTASALRCYTPDFRNTAIMEARRWLEERKSVSSSKLDQNRVAFTSNPRVLPNAGEGRAGSPVDMAKSYMKSRPLWASPTLGHYGFQCETPSPIATHLFKEESPYSLAGHNLHPPEALRRSSIVDSWNTVDETRTVRFNLGENTLQPAIDLEHKCSETSSTLDKSHLEVGGTHGSNSLRVTRHEEAPADVVVNGGFSVHGRTGDKTNSTGRAILHSDKNQDLVDFSVVLGEGSTSLVVDAFSVEPLDTRAPEGNHPTEKDINGSKVRCVVKSQPLLASSSSVDLNAESGVKLTNNGDNINESCSRDGKLTTDLRPTTKEDFNLVSSSVRRLATITPAEEEICELLSEASVEVPLNEETVSGSQNSSSRHPNDGAPISSYGNARQFNDKAEKQQLKKVGRYTRRSRGMGN
ncbi:hypothetical protein GIB67_023348 [Kingdonia uniflora]|uniref:Protein KAKU4-like n=1 Tax=Kingdonia uniflora TaxID=39325 RepID=A0A7J7LI54_9MAGN|nr:hypothetical protein GIB67_023348 [Kingdonia uniflora]